MKNIFNNLGDKIFNYKDKIMSSQVKKLRENLF